MKGGERRRERGRKRSERGERRKGEAETGRDEGRIKVKGSARNSEVKGEERGEEQVIRGLTRKQAEGRVEVGYNGGLFIRTSQR